MAYTTVNKSTEHFNTKLYTGNGSTNAITGVGFQPDLTWIKNRTDTSNNNLYDAVRGTSAGKLKSNTNVAQSYNAQDLSTFGTDGFTVGSNNEVNGSGDNMVSWNWKANGAGSSNTDGSITSTVSVNQTAGFSIVKWTGTEANATIGHGLGSAPKAIIVKGLSTTHDWVYGGDNLNGFGNSSFLTLNTSNAVNTATPVWIDTLPTSSVFSVGSNQAVNQSGVEHIAYCFAEIQGYSKFGSYIGNSSANYGSFIYTGFKPSFFMVKNTATAEDWMIYDNKRDPNNVMQTRLRANRDLADTTNTDYYMDFLSNGIKLYAGNSAFNANSNKMIFMAFGQSLVGSNNVPCTAR